jgi:acetoacetate decarboxylase
MTLKYLDLSPAVPALPFRMRDAEIFTVAYTSNPDSIAAFVPEELEPLGDRVLLHFYRIHDAGPYGSYSECSVQLPVRHDRSGTVGAFSPILLLGSDGAIATGRELFGQRKKAATVTLAPDGDLLVARVQRNGIDVVTATMPCRQAPSTPAALQELSFGTNINLKIIPAVDGSGDAVRELTARDFTDVDIHEVWEGFGTVELRPNAQAPLHLLPVRDVMRALYWRADFTANFGRVLESCDTPATSFVRNPIPALP